MTENKRYRLARWILGSIMGMLLAFGVMGYAGAQAGTVQAAEVQEEAGTETAGDSEEENTNAVLIIVMGGGLIIILSVVVTVVSTVASTVGAVSDEI